MIDITPILEGLLVILSGIAIRYLIPWLKAKTASERVTTLNMIDTGISVLVEAAEQLYASDQGQAKKKYVLDRLSDFGVYVSGDRVEALIEAEVLRLHNAMRETAPIPSITINLAESLEDPQLEEPPETDPADNG